MLREDLLERLHENLEINRFKRDLDQAVVNICTGWTDVKTYRDL